MTVSTNVTETEKDTQNEKTKEFVINEREKKNPEKTNKIEINNLPVKNSRIINKNSN